MFGVYSGTFRPDYSRFAQTPFAYSRLHALKCVVVGAGALGNEVALILGLLGAGWVAVVDPDSIEASNLPRSIFFNGRNKMSKNKAQALAESASEQFPDTHWVAFPKEIADIGFQTLAECSLILSCVDNDLARVEVAYIGKRVRVPVADGGLGQQNYSRGRVTYFPAASEQACYACMLSARRRAELLQTWQATVRSCSNDNDKTSELVSTPMMASVIAGIQVELGLRELFAGPSATQVAHSIELRIHPSFQIEDVHIPVSVSCPFHEPERFRAAFPGQDLTFEYLMDHAGSDLLLLDWPICVNVRCLECGTEWSPKIRVATLRRRGRCPECSSRKLLELEVLRAIDRESAWIRSTPADLRLPPDHLYSFRPRYGTQ